MGETLALRRHDIQHYVTTPHTTPHTTAQRHVAHNVHPLHPTFLTVNKWTCLHFAGAYGGTRIAKFLLMAGADKFAMSTSYKSAADVALDAGKERVHAFISKYLEKPDPHKVKGFNILMKVLHYCQLALARALVLVFRFALALASALTLNPTL